MDHTLSVLPSRKATALWLVLNAPTHERMARLSWPGWMVTYWDKCPTPGIEPGYGYTSHDPSTNRALRGLTSLIDTNTLPLRQATTVYTVLILVFILLLLMLKLGLGLCLGLHFCTGLPNAESWSWSWSCSWYWFFRAAWNARAD